VRILTLSALVLLHASSAMAQRADARVESLLRRMTLEEKAGEMTQLTIQAVGRRRGTADSTMLVDSAKLDDAILRHHIGSLLNVWDVAMTPAQWTETINAIQRAAGRTRLKIPVVYGIDAVHGVGYLTSATIFPQEIAMAATWNPSLVRREHQITAYEARAAGIPWNFAPVLDLARQPLWSRFFETYGEDPYLASVLGREAVLGEQTDPRPSLDSLFTTPVSAGTSNALFVAATGKHFLGYSAPLSGKDRTTAWIPDRQLREYYLPSFRAAIDAGLSTMMINSGDINGVPVHSSHEILTDLLRTELGFKGVVVSDWADIDKLYTVHHVASSRRDAVRIATLAGVDMSMVPYDVSLADTLVSLVRDGSIPMSRIDQAVRRILKLKLDLGLFENPWPDSARLTRANSAPFQAASRAAAEEAVTLLKNDRGMLPLAKSGRIFVAGPGAASLPMQYGSWTYTWQGTDTRTYPATGVKTLIDAVRDRAGAAQVSYLAAGKAGVNVDSAVAMARNADVVIVALAEFPSAEEPGSIDDITFDAAQLALARALEATGKPVVLTIFQNRPRIVREVVDGARAIVTGYETGPFGGEALADVLFGNVNPSGKLPFSWPRFAGTVIPYDRAGSRETGPNAPLSAYNPEWAFGHGLSYTTFVYSNLRLSSETARATDTVIVSVDVSNTGTRAGREVVQLYVRDRVASIAPPVQRLRGFEKVSLAPGESRTVSIRLPVSRLAFVGRDNRFVVEPGEFDVMVGSLTHLFVVR
jgi:beta-glucosidase